MSDSGNTIYTEFPGDEIVAVHFKKKDEPPPPDETPDYGGRCGNGWFPWGGFYPGGGGFPPQITNANTDMRSGWGVQWNPVNTIDQLDLEDPDYWTKYFTYVIPGQYCKSETISIVWAGVLPPMHDLPPQVAGLWILPSEYKPYPPYLNDDGERPPNHPPFDPDISGVVLGSGRISWTGEGFTTRTVVATFVGTEAAPRARVAKPPFIIRPRSRITRPRVPPPEEGNYHYGWPGDPPDEGIWIEVEHDCTVTPWPPATS